MRGPGGCSPWRKIGVSQGKFEVGAHASECCHLALRPTDPWLADIEFRFDLAGTPAAPNQSADAASILSFVVALIDHSATARQCGPWQFREGR
jgi:hypothetical protein